MTSQNLTNYPNPYKRIMFLNYFDKMIFFVIYNFSVSIITCLLNYFVLNFIGIEMTIGNLIEALPYVNVFFMILFISLEFNDFVNIHIDFWNYVSEYIFE